MEWLALLGILLVLAGAAVLAKATKLVLKGLFLITLLFFIYLISLVFFVVNDLQELQDNLPEKDKVLLLHEKENLLYGGKIGDLYKARETKMVPFAPFSNNEEESYASHFRNKNYDYLLKDAYRLIVIDINFYEQGIPSNFSIHHIDKSKYEPDLTKEQILKILRGEEVNMNISVDRARQSALWFGFLASVQDKGNEFFLKSWKSGLLSFYPETAALRAAKKTPLFIMKLFVKDIKIEVGGEVITGKKMAKEAESEFEMKAESS